MIEVEARSSDQMPAAESALPENQEETLVANIIILLEKGFIDVFHFRTRQVGRGGPGKSHLHASSARGAVIRKGAQTQGHINVVLVLCN